MRFMHYFDVSEGSSLDVDPYKIWANEFVGERGVDWEIIWNEVNMYGICFIREQDLIIFRLKFGL